MTRSPPSIRAISSTRPASSSARDGGPRGAAAHPLLDDQMVGWRGRRWAPGGSRRALGGPPAVRRSFWPDHVRHAPADARVHLVEHQGRHLVRRGEDGLDGEHRARQLAPGHDLGERAGGPRRGSPRSAAPRSPRREARGATAPTPEPRSAAPAGSRRRATRIAALLHPEVCAPPSAPGAPAAPRPGRGPRRAVRLRPRPRPRRPRPRARARPPARRAARCARAPRRFRARYAGDGAGIRAVLALEQSQRVDPRVDLLEPLRDRRPRGRGAPADRSTASSRCAWAPSRASVGASASGSSFARPRRRAPARPSPLAADRSSSYSTAMASPRPATMRSACCSRLRSARSASSSPSRGSTASISESWKR